MTSTASGRPAAGDLSSDNRSLSVFVNCPFDTAYAPLRDAILFTTVCAGFLPVSANDVGGVSEPRMERILRGMSACRYSIHDLSRCRGQGDSNLARFNMPLELGIAMASKHLARDHAGGHDWLALVPRGHAYLQYVSDLAGYDPMQHDGTQESVVRVVTAWLWTLEGSLRRFRPDEVNAALPAFSLEHRGLLAEFGGAPPLSTVYDLARRTTPAGRE